MARAIGIDLGTTNSAMAYMSAGEPEIIENSEGQRITPSVVAVNTKTSERLIGMMARRQAVTNPEHTVYSAKRFIGRRFDDDLVRGDQERVPFTLFGLENGDVGIQFDGSVRPPAEISSMLLARLKSDAEERLGEPVTQAVITVPAYFNDAQREATRIAGTIAGLEVLRIVNEPTAAALAYGLDKEGERTVAVYDLGGGTFDITILHVGDGVFEVKSTNGDTHLGGDDFDTRLVDYLVDEFKKKEYMDPSTDPSAAQRLRLAAEEAKIELSSVTSAEINLPFISADQSGPKHLVETLTRAKLESLTADLLEKTVGPCQNALRDAGVTAADIDDVILAGGMTRMPTVINRVKEIFGKEPNRTINPDEVVALGAALQAGVLQGDVSGILLLDVTPLTWGIETLGGVRTELIPRNTTIPTSKSDTFTTAADGQSSVEIHVLQGERPMAADNTSVGRFSLDGIAPAPRGVPQVEVSFDIDANGIITVTAKDKATQREQHITVTGRSGMSEDEIKSKVKEAEDNADADRLRRESVDSRNLAESTAYQADKLIEEHGERLPEDVKSDIQSKTSEVRTVLADENADAERVKAASEALQQAMMAAGQHIHAGAAAGAAPGGDEGQQPPDDDTVEGRFREV
ncbi:MAG: molecular chaperone DnaK [Chloroflexi bacterium]|nr:molecular chaperone DnaK [Chloroflexota bacterium]MYF80115.1 molecular chaperone DnaK [Chloroflexota bacterium]